MVPEAEAGARPAMSGRALFWRLFWIYILGSFVAVGVTLFLGTLGLEFSLLQWAAFWGSVPVGVGFYMAIDVVLILRHIKPLGPVLDALNRGGPPPERAILGEALV